MQKAALLVLGLAGLTMGAAAVVYERRAAAPPLVAAEKVETLVAPNPPLAPPPDVSRPAAPSPSEAPLASPAPVAAAAPDLPTIEVKPRPVYAVPADEPPVPKVTLYDRSGKEIPTHQAALPPYSPPAPAPPVLPFGGPAQAGGGTTLAVAGKSVRLFGVRVADPRDRCGLGPGDARNCSDVARDALAQRLRRYPSVSCQMPPGQRGDPAAICIDASGTDLGGFLVAEGFALADISQSYEYFGSEGVARYYRRGLWRNR
jgi:endonuclease YncB( thermonuclease family)